MVLAVFSVSCLLFSSSSQLVISSESHDVRDWLKNNDEDKSKNDVTVNPPKGMTKCHPTFVWVVKQARCRESEEQSWNPYP